jgi:uncharacterized membrane protein
LSDGVFAVATTLSVLDLRAPAAKAVHSEHDLWRGLVALSPRLLMFMTSLLILGILWVGRQTQLHRPSSVLALCYALRDRVSL